jgi:hypothetical protein
MNVSRRRAVGKVESDLGFPPFPQLLAWQALGCSLPARCPWFPLSLVLDRAQVVPVQHLVWGLLPGFKTPPLPAFHFERSEQRFAAGIVPAVAFPAPRRLNPILPPPFLERFLGLLTAPIAVKEQPSLPLKSTPEPSPLQRIDDQFLAQIIR